jgi:nucleoside-diphosphate-sugar epimerase
MILIHVDDVARGLVRIAALDGTQASGKSFVLADMEPVSMPMFCGLAATLLRVRAPGRIPKWLAAWVAGRPIVETLLHKETARRTILPGSHLLYPSYREGLPATLCAMGLLNSSDPLTSAPSS